MTKRTKNFVVRLDDQEHAMVQALADAIHEPMTTIVRRLLRAAYLERFGLTPPKKSTAK